METVLSGMRPTGKLHIGHLEGVLSEWVPLQENYDCNYFVADLHAITTEHDTRLLKENTIDKHMFSVSVNVNKKNTHKKKILTIIEMYALWLLSLDTLSPIKTDKFLTLYRLPILLNAKLQFFDLHRPIS